MLERDVYQEFKNLKECEIETTFIKWVKEDKPRARFEFNQWIDHLRRMGHITERQANNVYLAKFIKCAE